MDPPVPNLPSRTREDRDRNLRIDSLQSQLYINIIEVFYISLVKSCGEDYELISKTATIPLYFKEQDIPKGLEYVDEYNTLHLQALELIKVFNHKITRSEWIWSKKHYLEVIKLGITNKQDQFDLREIRRSERAKIKAKRDSCTKLKSKHY
jgi:hypothetical protein